MRILRGDHLLIIHSTPRLRVIANGPRPLSIVVALTFLVAGFAPLAQEAAAKAPPLANTVLDVTALTTPDYGATEVAVIPQGTEIELSGEAAPGFLAVYYDDQVVWVPAQNLTLGVRPGIDTAVAVEDTPLLDAPMPEATVLEIVLEGQAVLLSGASVDGYDAASYDGTGGWIHERALSR
jgi:hypothetical protein